MSYRGSGGKFKMHVFACDWRVATCGEEFRSASIKSVLGAQLKAAGWQIVIDPGGKATERPLTEFVDGPFGKRDRLYFCPKHIVKPVAKMP